MLKRLIFLGMFGFLLTPIFLLINEEKREQKSDNKLKTNSVVDSFGEIQVKSAKLQPGGEIHTKSAKLQPGGEIAEKSAKLKPGGEIAVQKGGEFNREQAERMQQKVDKREQEKQEARKKRELPNPEK